MAVYPFDPAEISEAGLYDEGGRSPYPHFTTPITPKENFMRARRREKPAWIPMRSDTISFTPRCIPDNIARGFVMDGGPRLEHLGGPDMFGVEWIFDPTIKGSMVRPGAPILEDVCDWEKVIQFPDVDSWDWEGSAQISKDYLNTDRVIEAWHFTGFFERLISFVDFEAAAMALIDEDSVPYVHSLFQALTDLYKKIIAKQKQYFGIDMVYFHDDWGGQKDPFFSLRLCRELLVPYMKQIVDFCHENEIIFDFHCCGKNEMLVPAMIECGMDAWGGQPINDKAMLHEKYGDKLMIAINSPFRGEGTDAEIERFCRDFVAKYMPTIQERPVYLADTFPHPLVRKLIYELSRMAD